jgi:8-amino-7-oxononanoate synthase
MTDSFAWIDDELRALQDLGLQRRLATRNGPQGSEIELDGQRLINFGSNDYLGLAAADLSAAATEAIQRMGIGSGASPLVTGRTMLHARLEQALAEFEGTQAALVFSSGYAANAGSIAALVSKGDVVLSDAKNHASIIDGCRLSGARIVVYPHRDITYVEMMLKQASTFRRRLIVTDSLFSMDGDAAPLVELAELAERHQAMMLVDEAHATGVFGKTGRGLVEHLQVEDRVHVRVGTLSKALGCSGGFVAGPQKVIDWLSNRARPYVFSTAGPALAVAAAMRALEIVRSEPQRRRIVLDRASKLRTQLQELGWNIGDAMAQIVPVFIGEPAAAMRGCELLRERGLFVPGIRPPTVPAGESLLRISVTYAHSDAMLQRLAEAFVELRRLTKPQ